MQAFVFIKFDCHNFVLWFLSIEHPSDIINYKCLHMQKIKYYYHYLL